jgi:prevent-host-death family protein
MKTLAVGELKANFSSVLDEVKSGHAVAVGYGKRKTKLAVIVPYEQYRKTAKRKIGVLDGRVRCRIKKDFRMSDEELLSS